MGRGNWHVETVIYDLSHGISCFIGKLIDNEMKSDLLVSTDDINYQAICCNVYKEKGSGQADIVINANYILIIWTISFPFLFFIFVIGY